MSDAIRQQEQAVQVAREDYERKRDAWRERRVEANAIGKAMERLKCEEDRADANRERQQADEQSAAQRRSRKIGNETGQWKIGSSSRWKVKDEK